MHDLKVKLSCLFNQSQSPALKNTHTQNYFSSVTFCPWHFGHVTLLKSRVSKNSRSKIYNDFYYFITQSLQRHKITSEKRTCCNDFS